MLKVIDAKVLDAEHMRIAFDDGIVSDVDCSFLFHGALGVPLQDPDYFAQVTVDKDAGTVVWPNGLDPAPEVLRDHGRQTSAAHSPRTALLQGVAEEVAPDERAA